MIIQVAYMTRLNVKCGIHNEQKKKKKETTCT